MQARCDGVRRGTVECSNARSSLPGCTTSLPDLSIRLPATLLDKCRGEAVECAFLGEKRDENTGVRVAQIRTKLDEIRESVATGRWVTSRCELACDPVRSVSCRAIAVSLRVIDSDSHEAWSVVRDRARRSPGHARGRRREIHACFGCVQAPAYPVL